MIIGIKKSELESASINQIKANDETAEMAKNSEQLERMNIYETIKLFNPKNKL